MCAADGIVSVGKSRTTKNIERARHIDGGPTLYINCALWWITYSRNKAIAFCGYFDRNWDRLRKRFRDPNICISSRKGLMCCSGELDDPSESGRDASLVWRLWHLDLDWVWVYVLYVCECIGMRDFLHSQKRRCFKKRFKINATEKCQHSLLFTKNTIAYVVNHFRGGQTHVDMCFQFVFS